MDNKAQFLLKALSAFLGRNIVSNYWVDPIFMTGIGAAVLAIGIGAGLYPALVLAAFRPAATLRVSRGLASGGRLRQVLVVMQFTASIGLSIATLVVVQQIEFATGQSLRFDKDEVLLVPGPEACRDAVRDRVVALPGVRAAVCAQSAPLYSTSNGTSTMPDGRQFNVNKTPVDFGFFEFYGLEPIAGRFFDRRRPGDAVPEGSSSTWSSPVVINETAVRIYGFAGPVQAIGQQVTVGAAPSEIIGVVPDFPIGSIRESVEPTAFYVDPARWSLLSVKLDGAHVTEDLAAIDRIWADNVPDRPARHYFLDAKIEELYRDISREGQLFAAFAAVSFVIGCLGLFGLSAFSAERRTKEIGVRKALGASAFDVAKLMVWQFVKPVAFANLLAWPIAWWLLHHWLDSFAHRIELRPEPFVAAGLLALVIAVLTTAFHAVQAAQSRPVLALRNA